jgi:glutamyl-tRNA(Gln) amidotransferase subunit E
MDEKEIKKILKEIVEKNKGAPFNALMGQAMTRLRGKADGKKIVELLKKEIT